MRRTLVISSLWIATMAAAVGGTTAVINAGDASGTVLKPAEVGKRLTAGTTPSPVQPTRTAIRPVAGGQKITVRANEAAKPGSVSGPERGIVGSVFIRCTPGKVDIKVLRIVPAPGWRVVASGGTSFEGLVMAEVAFKKPLTGRVTVFTAYCGTKGGMSFRTGTY